MIATLVRDAAMADTYRVEALDDEGGMAVTIFSGVDALNRAIIHAGSDYYESWSDPDALTGV